MKVVSLVILFALLQNGPAYPAVHRDKRTGKVSGVVLDLNEARIVDAVVTIQNPKVKRRVKSGYEGEFEIELPAGIYELTVEAGGFCKFYGESLKVKHKETEMVNIHMRASPCGYHE